MSACSSTYCRSSPFRWLLRIFAIIVVLWILLLRYSSEILQKSACSKFYDYLKFWVGLRTKIWRSFDSAGTKDQKLCSTNYCAIFKRSGGTNRCFVLVIFIGSLFHLVFAVDYKTDLLEHFPFKDWNMFSKFCFIVIEHSKLSTGADFWEYLPITIWNDYAADLSEYLPAETQLQYAGPVSGQFTIEKDHQISIENDRQFTIEKDYQFTVYKWIYSIENWMVELTFENIARLLWSSNP